MPVTRELSLTWDTTAVGGSSITIGGSSARQIESYTIIEDEYEQSAFEFAFITTATTAAAFATEVAALEAAFRRPRGDLVVTQESQTLLSWKHSDNTGLDTSPRILKQGDIGDTGRSRHYRVRIEAGRPANNVSTNFRRYSTVSVDYSPSRQRTITISGTYTANSSDGTTAAFTQYRAQIAAYGSSVTAFVDAAATWEIISEPSVEYNDTNKVCDFTISYKEILANQRSGTLDDLDIVDPKLVISRHREAPGDSTAGGLAFSGMSAQGVGAGGNGIGGSNNQRPTVTSNFSGGGSPGATGTILRPWIITVEYSCNIDQTRTKDLKAKWTGAIRPFLIAQAQAYADNGGLCLVSEKANFGDIYANVFSATMEFHAYVGNIFAAQVTCTDETLHGGVLTPVTTRDPFDYYEFPGPAVRRRIVREEYERKPTAGPHDTLEQFYAPPGALVRGLTNAEKWLLIRRSPSVSNKLKGLTDGPGTVLVDTLIIETELQFRNKKPHSTANAGGVTGANLTG